MAKTIIQPSYYDDFVCVGGACEMSCCENWNVGIDKNTYLKYKAVKDPEFAELFKTHIRRNKKNRDGTQFDYASIDMGPNNSCPFLDEDLLCRIHARFGPSYLSKTCTTFPRRAFTFDAQTMHVGMTSTCPEVLHTLIKTPAPLTFIQKPLVEKELTLPNREMLMGGAAHLITQVTYHGLSPRQLYDIHSACIDIMQAGQYRIDERLFIIGLYLNAVQQAVDNNSPDEVSAATSLYARAAATDAFAGKLTELEISRPIYDSMRHAAFNTFASAGRQFGFFTQNVITRLTAKNGILPQNLTAEELYNHVAAFEEENRENFFDPLLTSSALENFFVNMMAATSFPYKSLGELTIFQHFYDLALQFALIRAHICTGVDPERGVDEKLLFDTLILVSHFSMHTNAALTSNKAYAGRGPDTLAQAVALLK